MTIIQKKLIMKRVPHNEYAQILESFLGCSIWCRHGDSPEITFNRPFAHGFIRQIYIDQANGSRNVQLGTTDNAGFVKTPMAWKKNNLSNKGQTSTMVP